MDPKLKANIEIGVTTFLGGAGTFVTAHLLAPGGMPTTAAALEAFASGALMAGLGAVYHRYQPSPGDVAKALAAKATKAVAALALLAGLGASTEACAAVAAWFKGRPNVPTEVVETEQCIQRVLNADAAAGDNDLTIGINIGAVCGSDAVALIDDVLEGESADAGAPPAPTSKAARLLAARAAHK